MQYLSLTMALSTGLLLTACSLSDRPFVDASSQALTTDSPQLTTTAQAPPPIERFIAARRLAWEAAVIVQHPPHPADTWQAARVKWRQAINLLEMIPDDATIAPQAKEKMALYQANYAAISQRLATETAALDQFKTAQTFAWQAAVTVQKPPHSLKIWQRASRKWQAAIALLEPIPPTTAIAQQSQTKLATYRSNYNAINQRLATEVQAFSTLKQFSETAAMLQSIPEHTYQANLTPQKIGVSYEAYTRLIQKLQQAFNQFAAQPDAKKHPIYPTLLAAIADHQVILKLWKDYLSFKAANAQWLYDDVFDQQVPVSLPDAAMLMQQYGIKVDPNSTKVSLRFSAWTIWQKTSQRVRQAQQLMLKLDSSKGEKMRGGGGEG